MIAFREIREAFLQLLFPHICAGCGTDILSPAGELCMRCMEAMPETNFELHPYNPVEKMFWGRLPLLGASAQFYFTKESRMQRLMHLFKYKGNRDLGFQLGRIMGEQMVRSERFMADALIPLPLFPAKEKKRGFNQATILCEGMSDVMKIPVWNDVVCRPQHTETQTRKGRIERWKNMEGRFFLQQPERVRNKHLLLVDDVVTTGATLEACGLELLKADDTRLSIATLCTAVR